MKKVFLILKLILKYFCALLSVGCDENNKESDNSSHEEEEKL